MAHAQPFNQSKLSHQELQRLTLHYQLIITKWNTPKVHTVAVVDGTVPTQPLNVARPGCHHQLVPQTHQSRHSSVHLSLKSLKKYQLKDFLILTLQIKQTNIFIYTLVIQIAQTLLKTQRKNLRTDSVITTICLKLQ